MEIKGFKKAKSLKWLRNYILRNKGNNDRKIIETASKRFQKETGYIIEKRFK